jgi:hypothetical protein
LSTEIFFGSNFVQMIQLSQKLTEW